MTSQIEIKARVYFEGKKNIQAVEIGLEQLSITDVKTADEFTTFFLNLAYSLYAASEAKLYKEFLKIFKCYIGVVNRNSDLEPPVGYHNHACLMQHNLMATIFKYYDSEGRIEEIIEAMRLLKFWTSKVPDQSKLLSFNSSILKLSELIIESKHPYYVVDFRLPLALPLPDGKYDIKTEGNVTSIEVESRRHEDLTSIIGDRFFSSVKITVRGFTSTDNYWVGPSLTDRDGPYNINICLRAINEMLLTAKLVKEDLRLRILSSQDIGRSTTAQFNGDGEGFHSTINFGFGGDSLVDVLSKQELGGSDIERLKERLTSSKLEIHEKLFSEALIEQSNDNTTAAFYLINSSCESLIQRKMYLAAIKNEKENEYNILMKGKSFCNECDLYIKSKDGGEPPRKAMPPSLFSQLKFFKQIGLITNRELKDMGKNLSKIRNDELRNSLIHGRTNYIPKNSLFIAIENYKVLKEKLTDLVE